MSDPLLRPSRSGHTSHVAILPLLAALAIMTGVSLRPQLLTAENGNADHIAALLVFWAMSAGFVRGVGFIPRWWGWRWLLSGSASLAALVLAGARLSMQS